MISFHNIFLLKALFLNIQAFSAINIIAIILLCLLILISAVFIKRAGSKLIDAKKELSDVKKEKDELETNAEKKEKEINELKELVAYQRTHCAEKDKERAEMEKNIDAEVLKRTSELHTLLEKSEESNKLKDAFLDKISREVRTPLNAILGFINLLNNPDLSEQDKNYYYKYIQESGNNLLSLIDNIIDFSKLETNDLLIEPKKCRLNVLLTDLVEKYKNRLVRQNNGVQMVFKKPDEDLESLVDCKRFIHIAEQLLNNAIRYTHEGKISVLYEIREDNHYFEVTDTGDGIDKKYQDIIFERFYQIDGDKRDNFSGAGLGLTLAKGLIDLLGGTITVNSTPGKGSTFSFSIPYISIDNLSSKKSKSAKDFNWKGKRILIAEDEESNYHFLEAILKKTKVTLIHAVDGVQFLELMDKHKDIDLVLLDIKMPGINGFNAIKVVRQQNITIPVIAQTAFNQPEDKQRCLESGCNDYLAKPIDKDLLLSKIARFFES